jgi:3-isopropylmalate/(R)-2-methylmalate dehydratase small subunit
MNIAGRAHRFGDDINTDYIISSKYKSASLDPRDLTRHLMEDIDPGFGQRVRPGDILVAGKNFGCGSSREGAPLVIKASGISVVVAPSFARIFFRNAINIGLPVFICDTAGISTGDELEFDLEAGSGRNRSTGEVITAAPLPRVMINIVRDGGLAAHIRRHGTFQVA